MLDYLTMLLTNLSQAICVIAYAVFVPKSFRNGSDPGKGPASP